MIKVLRKLIWDEDGQDLAEYGIALLVVAAGAAAFAVTISGNVSTLWSAADSVIASAAGAI